MCHGPNSMLHPWSEQKHLLSSLRSGHHSIFAQFQPNTCRNRNTLWQPAIMHFCGTSHATARSYLFAFSPVRICNNNNQKTRIHKSRSPRWTWLITLERTQHHVFYTIYLSTMTIIITFRCQYSFVQLCPQFVCVRLLADRLAKPKTTVSITIANVTTRH